MTKKLAKTMLFNKILITLFAIFFTQVSADQLPLGKGNDTAATGEWWNKDFKGRSAWMNLMVPREEVIGFALYTTYDNTLKLTAQFYPLLPEETRIASLEVKQGDQWIEVAQSEIYELGWSAHFRVEQWDMTKDMEYRVLHADKASYAGLVRKDPVDKAKIVVASLSCNSKKDRGDRESIVRNIKLQNPDLLFFAGDQSYDHKEHTAAWLQFGRQFGEIMRDRPTITIPDDHDVYHGNIWGLGGGPVPEGGSKNSDGGYAMHPEWVRMVERTQVSNLPDPYDPTPVLQDIGVYYTDFNYGGISMAVLEDRKFKSGPAQAVDKKTHKGRVDHVRDYSMDPKVLDKPGLSLLGERQEKFLEHWAGDYRDASMKAILSQSPFCAVATHHGGGKDSNILIADLDSNGWPQSGRNRAIELARKAHAVMIHGDQHLATVVHHGVEEWNDAGFSFAGAGICNGYPRLWAPKESGKNRRPGSPNYTGEFLDGFHNKINVWAAANRIDKQYPEKIIGKPTTMLEKLNNSASGYGIVKFHKIEQEITMESWPIYENMTSGITSYETHNGWPITVTVDQQYSRKPVGYLAPVKIKKESLIVRVRKEPSGELVYARRVTTGTYRPKVFEMRSYRVEVGEPGNWKTFKNQKIQN